MEKHPRDAELHLVHGGEDEKSRNDPPAKEQSGRRERVVQEAGFQRRLEKNRQRDHDAGGEADGRSRGGSQEAGRRSSERCQEAGCDRTTESGGDGRIQGERVHRSREVQDGEAHTGSEIMI